MRRRIAGLKTRESALEIERRVGELSPAAERKTVLNFFAPPALDVGDRLCVGIAEDALKVRYIIRRSEFDERGGFHRSQQAGRDFRPVEAVPPDVIERPSRTINRSRAHPCSACLADSNELYSKTCDVRCTPIFSHGRPRAGHPVGRSPVFWVAGSSPPMVKGGGRVTAPRGAGAGGRAARRRGPGRPHSSAKQGLPRYF